MEASAILQKHLRGWVKLKKILIVEDEPEIILAVGMRLRAAGFEVLVASDGSAATQVVLSEKPDLILLDIGIPCGNGHIIMERLRANLDTALIPVIFLTARTGDLDREKAVAAGAAAYITKPFQAEELLRAVESAMSVCT